MTDFFDQIRGLFSTKKPHQSFLHELIERSEAEKAQYESWKDGAQKEQLIRALRSELKLGDNNAEIRAIDVQFINTVKTGGFVLYFSDDFLPADFQHLFDYIKEQVLPLGYTSYVSDVQSNIKGKRVETKERHHLKPRFSYNEDTGKSDHLYGNITIEHLLTDNKPDVIRFIVNIYADQHYTKAGDIMELYERILV